MEEVIAVRWFKLKKRLATNAAVSARRGVRECHTTSLPRAHNRKPARAEKNYHLTLNT
jgi:hypothetical protein